MTTDDDFLGFLQSNCADQAAAYAQAGRKHARLSLDALNAEWVAAFRAMVAQPLNKEAHTAQTAYDSEFILRGIEPPYSLVKDEAEAYVSAQRKSLSDLEVDDPEQFSDFSKDLERHLVDFRLKLERRS